MITNTLINVKKCRSSASTHGAGLPRCPGGAHFPRLIRKCARGWGMIIFLLSRAEVRNNARSATFRGTMLSPVIVHGRDARPDPDRAPFLGGLVGLARDGVQSAYCTVSPVTCHSVAVG